MSELLIIEPIQLNYEGPTPSLVLAAGVGSTNLLTNDPREIWSDFDAGNYRFINIDFGKDIQFDTVFLGNTNASFGSSWRLSYGTSSEGSGLANYVFDGALLPLPWADQPESRVPALYVHHELITARYVIVHVRQAEGQPLQIGRFIIGKALRPFYNKERGAQRVPFDTGTRTRLSDGSLSTVAGALISGFKWVFGNLSEAEANALWGIVRRRRTTEPVLLIEDAENLSVEGTHYCTLIDLEGYLRDDPTKNRWALSVEDWL